VRASIDNHHLVFWPSYPGSLMLRDDLWIDMTLQ
jgi:hypothetical protein